MNGNRSFPLRHRRAAPCAVTACISALALLVIAGCTSTNDGCFRDLDAEACRSRCRDGDTQACGVLEQIEAAHGDLGAQQRRCKHGDMYSCIQLADRQPDLPAKRRVLEEACAQGDVGAPACAHLADVTPDPAEKRRILERACATQWGVLACGRLAELEPDPVLRARRLAEVCVAGLEDKCARLADVDPSPASRRALLLEACAQLGPDCAIHPIAQAFRAARVPPEAPEGGVAPLSSPRASPSPASPPAPPPPRDPRSSSPPLPAR